MFEDAKINDALLIKRYRFILNENICINEKNDNIEIIINNNNCFIVINNLNLNFFNSLNAALGHANKCLLWIYSLSARNFYPISLRRCSSVNIGDLEGIHECYRHHIHDVRGVHFLDLNLGFVWDPENTYFIVYGPSEELRKLRNALGGPDKMRSDFDAAIRHIIEIEKPNNLEWLLEYFERYREREP